jgi:hypothetical protein
MSQALTHSPTTYSMQQVILEKAALTQLLKNSLFVNESKGSLLHSLGPMLNVMCPVHIFITYYFKIHFNIILPSMSMSSNWFSGLIFSPKFCMHFSSPPILANVLPSHSPWCDPLNNLWWKIQVMKILIIQFTPTSCYLIIPRSKHVTHWMQ